ncbi:carbohydrate ABC transporter membrane protein 1 (CUT1 family) [Ilumatobacter fluminis]|uniref:Carbohydrate ABC transporter membrane protein 1 (CUT1 family) n=1 Tax=Ilumatobacter fluminis TaxID=467091 RepID=A0A4R7HVB2_9ACTN|nr:carbohydrate ABC transporter membrane protein 1 (CUT1 family) [Ilumatobacter fluminis]
MPLAADGESGSPPPGFTADGSEVSHRRSARGRSPDRWPALAFLLPNLTLFTVFTLLPVVVGVGLSFYEWDLISSPEFVGLENYRRLLDDGEARHALWITALLILFGLLPTIVIGLVAATLLNAKFRGIRYIRTLYYMPIVISLVASGVLWRFIYEPNRGLLNWLLSLIGIDGPPWLSSTRWALPAIAMVLVWLAIPLSTMLYLAALQGIPSTVLEAARIDGAGFVAMLWHVIWPMVRPTTALVSLVTVLGLAFGSFDLIASLTQGGPLDSTNTLIYYMYDTAFNQLQVGYASALAVFNFVAVFGTLGAVLAIGRRLVK